MRFFSLFMVLAVAGIFFTCSSDNGVSQNGGMLQVLLTDKPIELSQVWVTITEIEAHQTGGAWQTVSSTSKSLDLLTLKNTESLIATASLATGHYTGFRLQISEGHVIDKQQDRCDLKIPSGKVEIPVVFQIQQNKTTKVVLDFNAEQSVHVVQTGNNETCILRPVIKPVSVQNGQ